MARKTPVLLRRAPLSGRINVLTNYSRSEINGNDMLTVRGDGTHDVSAAFYALLTQELLDGESHAGVAGEPSPDIIAILDGAADGEKLSAEERAQVRSFRERLREIIEAHNARSESGELAAA
jgi:hypothetical protein